MLFFTFSYTNMIAEVLFLGEIFEIMIVMNLHVLRSFNPKTTSLVVCLVRVYVYVSVITIVLKQIAAET